jgi:hypothetical protein
MKYYRVGEVKITQPSWVQTTSRTSPAGGPLRAPLSHRSNRLEQIGGGGECPHAGDRIAVPRPIDAFYRSEEYRP